MIELRGKIIRSLSGFYTVKVDEQILTCKARGIFRKNYEKPVVGDDVIVSCLPRCNIITKILPRKNFIVRPPLANLDLIIFVVSVCNPSVNYLVLDKLLIVSKYKKIESAIIITKTDLEPGDEIKRVYDLAGVCNICVNYESMNLEEIYKLINGKVCAFCGNSGVGKSTLLNNLFPELNLKTDKTSLKLGRGKHTTRAVELFSVGGGLVADTPGFSTVDILKYDKIPKEKLASCFDEFKKYSNCRFRTCSHIFEKDCKIRKAVNSGLIHSNRYNSYCVIYNELKRL